MSFIEKIIKSVVMDEAAITEKIKLSEAAYKIRLQSDKFSKAEFTPGSFLRMGIGIGKDELSMKDKIRSYSTWKINKQKGYLDVAIATHGIGVG